MSTPFPIPEDNPFSLVYARLWAMARANPKLMEWIPEGNQIDFSNWIGPKDDISDADTPELALISQSTFSNIHNTSTSSMVMKEYAWTLITGDFRMDDVYNQVQWELFRAMSSWCNELGKLQWNDKQFVTNANFRTSAEGSFFADENRHIRGWSLSWPIEVEMHFTTSEIQAGLLEIESC